MSSLRRHRRMLTLLLVLLALLLPFGSARAEYILPKLRIIESSMNSTSMPRTDGRYIAWYEDSGIKAFDLERDELITVASGGLYNWGVGVDNGVVVWTEIRGARDIRGKRLSTGELLEIGTASFDETYPTIEGRYVAWLMLTDQGQSLLLRDIQTMAAPITIGTWQERAGYNLFISQPFLDGTALVWTVQETSSARPPLPDMTTMYIYNVGDSAPRVLLEGSNLELELNDFNQGMLVYNREGQTRVYDTATRQERGIGPPGSSGIDGRYLFRLEHYDLSASKLIGFDLATNRAFPIESVLQEYVTLVDVHARNGRLILAYGPGRRSSAPNQSYYLAVAAIPSLLPSAPRRNPQLDNCEYFLETQHTLCDTMRDFWRQSGGLPVFGFPLTELLDELSIDTGAIYPVQYLERQRFELHAENADTPYHVQLGRLGSEILALQGRNWQDFPRASPSAPHYVPATGQAIAPEFWDYWRSHGLEFGDPGVSEREALALFGYPISPAQMERNSSGDTVLTQWYERARFEYHPGNPDPYKVLLGRLGAELLAAQG